MPQLNRKEEKRKEGLGHGYALAVECMTTHGYPGFCLKLSLRVSACGDGGHVERVICHEISMGNAVYLGKRYIRGGVFPCFYDLVLMIYLFVYCCGTRANFSRQSKKNVFDAQLVLEKDVHKKCL